MMKKITTLVLTTALTLSLAVAAQASLLSLDVTGSLDGATVLTTPGGSAPLGADTLFSYHAIFESTGGIPATNGSDVFFYLYPATTTFDLSGHGTYTSSSLAVFLADPSAVYAPGYYVAGLIDTNGDGLSAQSSTASPSFSMGAPTPSLLIDPVGMAYGALNFDGEVVLSNLTLGSASQTAELTAVPEPSTYALLCISLGVVGYARKRMVKREE